jgi:putative transposase
MTSYKFRLYPTVLQEHALEETLETCRRLYNALLEDRLKNHTGFFEQKRASTRNRKNNKYLARVNSQVVQDVVYRLDRALGSYFAGLARFPKFRRKGRYHSLTYPQIGGFKLLRGRLRLSMIGNLKMKQHRSVLGQLKTCTVVKEIDHWFAIIVTQSQGGPAIEEMRPAVGIDLGLKWALALSDGSTIQSPKFLLKSAFRIKSLQRSLSRKKEGSKNREKANSLLDKEWRKVRNARTDFAHKVSDTLTKKYGTLIFEGLNIRNMVKNHSLASAIMDASWGKLRRLAAYKAERRGGRAITVEPRGTSQECSGCGELVPKSLSERMHRCGKCGLELDRDVNAARNILSRGLEQAHAEGESRPIIRIGKLYRGSRKPTNSMAGSSLRKLSQLIAFLLFCFVQPSESWVPFPKASRSRDK